MRKKLKEGDRERPQKEGGKNRRKEGFQRVLTLGHEIHWLLLIDESVSHVLKIQKRFNKTIESQVK